MTDMKMILAATDFSRPAALAVRRAGQLARTAGARLELIHVLPPEPIPTSWTAVRDAFGLDPARIKDDAMARLTRAAGRIDAQPALPVELHLAQGQAPLYGYEQVLIATDFSAASVAAARAARRFFPEAMFHVLHAYEAPFEGRLAFAGVDDAGIERHRQHAGDQALRELDEFVRAVGLECDRSTVKARHGYPPARIKERASELDVDVTVLGTGKSWLEAGFLGSVSEHVAAESPCDVLLVRPLA
jgi:nucleotide-binding universal stress UspA family protein